MKMRQKLVSTIDKDKSVEEGTEENSLITTFNEHLVNLQTLWSAIREKKIKINIQTTQSAWNRIVRSNHIMSILQHSNPRIYARAFTYHQTICDDLKVLLEQSPQSYRELHYSYHNTSAYDQHIYRYINILEHAYQVVNGDMEERLNTIEYRSPRQKDVTNWLADIHFYIDLIYNHWPIAVSAIWEESHHRIYKDLKYLAKEALLRTIAITTKYISICSSFLEESINKNRSSDHILFSEYKSTIDAIVAIVRNMSLDPTFMDPTFMDPPSLCSLANAKERFAMLRDCHCKIT